MIALRNRFCICAIVWVCAQPAMAQDANAAGIQAFRSGDYAKAEQLYQQALGKKTDNHSLAAIYRNLAVLYQAQNKDGSEYARKADELESLPKKLEVAPQNNKDASTSNALQNDSALLQGRIEHSEKFPALAPDLRQGGQVNLTKLKALSANNLWEKVSPSWAGIWRTEEQTTLWTRELKTVMMDGKLVMKAGKTNPKPEILKFAKPTETPVGFQVDSSGTIWTCRGGDLKQTTDFGPAYNIDSVTSDELVSETDKKRVRRLNALRLVVDKATNRIAYSAQIEAISTESLIEDGIKKRNQSKQTFDENGMPIQLSETTSLSHRTSKFHAIDSYQGKDMRALFREFMVSHGMKNLL